MLIHIQTELTNQHNSLNSYSNSKLYLREKCMKLSQPTYINTYLLFISPLNFKKKRIIAFLFTFLSYLFFLAGPLFS